MHRAEESGTTDNFTKYLAEAGDWQFEGGKAWTAPGGAAEQGNDGVGKAIAATAGSIGYVEWGFAKDNNLPMAWIDNGAGPVELTAESAGTAVAAATIAAPDSKTLALKIDYATQEPGAYPVILVTYEILCAAGNGDKAEAAEVVPRLHRHRRPGFPGRRRRRPAARRDPDQGHRRGQGTELVP